MNDGLAARLDFLTWADRLKTVTRATVLMDLSRAENSAEHGWHVALWALLNGASDRAIAMILLHDLVEIELGDQPIHLPHDAAAPARAEAAAADRLFAMLPEGAPLAALWAECAAGESAHARAARRFDHSQPLFQVLLSPTPLPDHLHILRDNLDHGRAARLAEDWPEAVAAARALLAGQPVPGAFGARLALMAEADRLKSVLRATPLTNNSRHENSAEHSWHLALYALVLADQAAPGVDIGRVIRMLILHDLVEVDVGDVPIHAAGGSAHASAARVAAEAAAADRLFGLLPPDEGRPLRALWDEFEAAATPDAIFAKALDRVQPVVMNLASGGGSWRDYDVTLDQIEARVGAKVARGAPALWAHLQGALRDFFAAGPVA